MTDSASGFLAIVAAELPFSGRALIAAVPVGLALILLGRRPAAVRLRWLSPCRVGPCRVGPCRSNSRRSHAGRSPSDRPNSPRLDSAEFLRRIGPPAVAVLAGSACWVVIGGPVGLAAGIVVAVATIAAARRLEPAAVRRDRVEALAWLPFALDLLAASLRAGATPESALATVGAAIPDPLGPRLERVGSALALGAPPEEAWEELAAIPATGRLRRAGIRAAAGGAALDGALKRAADQLRADREQANIQAVRRSAVLSVLPVGLCFLPAFVLIAVVPTVFSVLSGVLR